jgi:hypothetical protein
MKRQQLSRVLLLSVFLVLMFSIAIVSLSEEGTGDIMCSWIEGCTGTDNQWCDDTDRWTEEDCTVKCYEGSIIHFMWCDEEEI